MSLPANKSFMKSDSMLCCQQNDFFIIIVIHFLFFISFLFWSSNLKALFNKFKKQKNAITPV